MQHFAIEATPRAGGQSKAALKALRRSGHLPAALSGKGGEAVPLTIPEADLLAALRSEAGRNALIDLRVEGRTELVRVATIDRDPIARTIQAVGLQRVRSNVPQKAPVAIVLSGEPEAIRTHAGRLEMGSTSVEVRALPERLVPSLTLPIETMQMGDVRRAGDLPLPDGFDLLTDPDTALVSLRVAQDLVVETEAIEPSEPTEAA
jgi:large subunit ribosomal protein L25